MPKYLMWYYSYVFIGPTVLSDPGMHRCNLINIILRATFKGISYFYVSHSAYLRSSNIYLTNDYSLTRVMSVTF